MADLLTRLEKLEGPCGGCDIQIHQIGAPQSNRLSDWPRYTASLDAIVGLIERDLPGMLWDRDARISLVTLYTPEYDADLGGGIFVSRHANPAIAFCIAYVKAKQAEEEG